MVRQIIEAALFTRWKPDTRGTALNFEWVDDQRLVAISNASLPGDNPWHT